MLVNIATIVPNGLVVFVPSYAFLEQAKRVWETSGLIARLGAKKRVFFEPRQAGGEGEEGESGGGGGGGGIEEMLREYAEAARFVSVLLSSRTSSRSSANG